MTKWMRPASDGWAELQPDGSITGQIYFHGGDEANFVAQPWKTSARDNLMPIWRQAKPAGVSRRAGSMGWCLAPNIRELTRV